MRRRKIKRKEVECNEVKEEIRWRGRGGEEKKSSRQMIIERTEVWTKGKEEHACEKIIKYQNLLPWMPYRNTHIQITTL